MGRLVDVGGGGVYLQAAVCVLTGSESVPWGRWGRGWKTICWPLVRWARDDAAGCVRPTCPVGGVSGVGSTVFTGLVASGRHRGLARLVRQRRFFVSRCWPGR
jgi:hypothetical protein